MTNDQFLKLGISMEWLIPLQDTFVRFEINTPKRQASFLAQCFYESNGFKELEENLNYTTARAIAVTWPTHFPLLAYADIYVEQPESLANVVYANRMGNGDEESGDGWKYRGRGLIQLTGKDNYKSIGDQLGIDLLTDPDQATVIENAVLTAGQFWKNKVLNTFADMAEWELMTRRINGGILGLDERIVKINEFIAILEA